MIEDNMVEIIDSPLYADTEYQSGNELIVYLRQNRRYLIVFDVSEKTFLKSYNNPTHKVIEEILAAHNKKIV